MRVVGAPPAAVPDSSRQLAASALAWRVGALWPSLAPAARAALASAAFSSLGCCDSRPTLRSVAELCNVLAQLAAVDSAPGPAGDGGGLLGRLLQQLGAWMEDHSRPAAREAALVLLAAIVESLGERLEVRRAHANSSHCHTVELLSPARFRRRRSRASSAQMRHQKARAL